MLAVDHRSDHYTDTAIYIGYERPSTTWSRPQGTPRRDEYTERLLQAERADARGATLEDSLHGAAPYPTRSTSGWVAFESYQGGGPLFAGGRISSAPVLRPQVYHDVTDAISTKFQKKNEAPEGPAGAQSPR